MIKTNILNDFLYHNLVKTFKSVKLSKEGQQCIYSVHGDKVNITDWGECYRVCCPGCINDTKHHLYIPHFYNAEISGIRMPKVVKCFRGCGITPTDFDVYLQAGVPNKLIYKGDPDILGVIKFKPHISYIPVTRAKDSDAYRYMYGRGFGDFTLDLYNVGVCTGVDDSRYDFLLGWVVFVTGDKDMTFAYQLRQPTEKDVELRYMTLEGSKPTYYMFGYPQASATKFNFVILVEGPTDVLRIGPPAVCMSSSSLSTKQLQLLWARWHDGVVFYTIDTDDAKFEEKQKAIHDRLFGQFADVVPLQLDSGMDPANYTREAIWDIIIRTASTISLPLC